MKTTLSKWLFILLLFPFFVDAKIETEKIFKWFVLPSGFLWWAEAWEELTLEKQIKNYIAIIAQQYELNTKALEKLAYCESSFNPNARGDYNSETDTFMARGLFQWWASSWKKYNNTYNMNLDRENWKHQTEMTARVLSDGDWWNWKNCIKNKIPELII